MASSRGRSTIERRPRAYADENVDARIVEALRERGFDVVTARDVRMLGQTDDAQLAYAADQGRVLLTFDRGNFRRLHARFVEAGREHAGIALLPQSRLIARTLLLTLPVRPVPRSFEWTTSAVMGR